ncbi:CPBP family intramembrane glutamic endopeptidase [Ekhidna sp.]
MNKETAMYKRAWAMLIMPPFMLMFVSVIFGVIFFIYSSGDGSAIPSYFQSYMPLITAVNHVSLFFILRYFLKKDNLTLKDIGWYVDPKKLPIDIFIGLGAAAILFFYNDLIIQPIQAIFRGVDPDFNLQFEIRNQIDWTFLAVAATLPLIEEMIYRGYAYRVLKSKYGSIITIIASSILFGALHWGMGILTSTLIIPFGILYFLIAMYRKGNLIAVTFSHLLYNSIVLIIR